MYFHKNANFKIEVISNVTVLSFCDTTLRTDYTNKKNEKQNKN